MTVPQNRVRAKKPKTKTGCVTCRQRRVKCDETKPFCRNCVNNGRTCAGYLVAKAAEQPQSRASRALQPKHDQCLDTQKFESARVAASPPRPWYWILRNLSSHEGMAFTFFRHHTARELQGWLDLRILEQWAMQLSHHEPAVLHALIAVGALHRLIVDQQSRTNANVEVDKNVALESYGKALSQLRGKLASKESKLDATVVLQTSLILFCFEMLRDEGTAAMQHLQSGLRILSEQEDKVNSHSPETPSVVALTSDPSGALEELVAVFAMLDFDNAMFSFQRVQMPMRLTLHGRDRSPHDGKSLVLESTSHARTWLNVLGNEIFHLLKELSAFAEQIATKAELERRSPRFWCYVHCLSHSVSLGSSNDEIVGRKFRLESELRGFAAALECLHARTERKNDRAMWVLEAQIVLLEFHIVTCRSTHEVDCDTFDSKFRRVVDLAERYISSTSSFGGRSRLGKRSYALEPGVVPTLCLVAAKCRVRTTRHRAIKLLKQSGLQEALWSSTAFGAFVERLAALEEETAVQLTSKHSKQELRHSLDVPERARFMDVNLVRLPGEVGRSKLLCARYAHEADGQIVFLEEYIKA